ncbi:hypothetical protein HG531_002667 [Fusarium graminearum]|nr:hypothetical protein HG531_002667 [Fusarium graminearum]
MKLSLTSMILTLGRSVLLVDTLRQSTVKVLKTLVSLLDLIPGVSIIANDTRPLFVVVPRTNAVDAKVDGAGTTETLSARVIQLSTVSELLRRSLVAPVHILVHKGEPSLAVNAEVTVRICATCFKEKNAGFLG